MAPDFIPFERFTYHAVPEGSPDSVSVMLYVTAVNPTLTAYDDPLIVKCP